MWHRKDPIAPTLICPPTPLRDFWLQFRRVVLDLLLSAQININKFLQDCPGTGWVAKFCSSVFGSFLMGKKHINKLPPNVPGTIPRKLVHVFSYLFFAPNRMRDVLAIENR